MFVGNQLHETSVVVEDVIVGMANNLFQPWSRGEGSVDTRRAQKNAKGNVRVLLRSAEQLLRNA